MSQPAISSFFCKRKRADDADTKENLPVEKVQHKSKEDTSFESPNPGACPDVYEEQHISNSWAACLEDQINKNYFIELTAFVKKERSSKTIYPKHSDVFSWTRYCDLNQIKVVILGQDPYHGPGQAHGLCFSVQPGVPPPPSLKNIYKALVDDVVGFKAPDHGYLIGWARQGVLLLNAVLTVERSKANSHKEKGWEKLTDSVIKFVSDKMDKCVFLLWGSPAIKKSSLINKSRHLILTSVHPSPLSAYRGFLTCAHFSKCNEYLAEHGKELIDWADLPNE